MGEVIRSFSKQMIVFAFQLCVLLVMGKLIGNRIMGATWWRSSMAACSGYYFDFRFVIGTAVAGILVGAFLVYKRSTPRSMLLFVIAIGVVEALFAMHIGQATCS